LFIPYYSLYQSLCLGKLCALNEEQRLFFQALGLSFHNQSLQDIALYDLSPYNTILPRALGPLQLYYYWIVTSTLDIAPYAPLNTIHWADAQIAAKGQYNRRWCSALGRQIQLTLSLSPSSWSLLWPIYALYKTLAPWLLGRALTFKWPNDLYLDGLKVAGMLTHHFPDRTLISLGLNTTFFQNQPKIQPLWSHPHPLMRSQLIAQWIERLYAPQPLSDEEIALFLTQRHLVPSLTSCRFSTHSDRMIFQNIAACGQVVLSCPVSGDLEWKNIGSFVLDL